MTTGLPQERVLRVLLLGERIEEFRRVRELLHDQGSFHVHGARDTAQAADLMTGERYDSVLVDSVVWENSGSELMEHMREHQPEAAIVVITDDEESGGGQSRSCVHREHSVVGRESLNNGEHLARRIIDSVKQIHSNKRETILRWLEQDARSDALTGLQNRHAFDQRLAELCDASKDSGDFVTVVLASACGRDAIVDTYGASAGDDLVRRTATCVSWCIRGNDFAARFDDDTIAVLLDGADVNVAQMVARRIVHRIHQENASTGMRSAPIEAAFGIASGASPAPADLVAAAMAHIETQKATQAPPVPLLYNDDEDDPSVA